MSHYKPYPAYKDSGIAWLGKIPKDWGIKRLRFVANPKNSNIDKKEYEGQSKIKLCNYTDVYYNDIIKPELDFMSSTASNSEIEKFSLLAGDVIITKDSEAADDIGIPAYVPHDLLGVVCGYHLTILRSYDVEGEFLFRLIQSKLTKAYFFIEVRGVTRFGLGQEDINNIIVPLPCREEQQLLCQWMNSETARIDGLISKKTDFLNLLREKRQALISHAVTKGLDPDVKMKDSGVEWLGEVPAHWVVAPMKYICELLKDGTHLPPPRVDDGVRLLSVRNIIDGCFTERDDDSKISRDDYNELCRSFIPIEGDVLLAVVGATLGKTAVVPDGLENFHIQRSLAIFRPYRERMESGWLHLIFQSSLFQSLLWEHAGYSAQPGIYLGSLSSFVLPQPPIEEQHSIMDYLRVQTTRLQILITKTESSIELLKERRSALITAAVTGQIDLREAA